jgi:hypothetical protein
MLVYQLMDSEFLTEHINSGTYRYAYYLAKTVLGRKKKNVVRSIEI